MFQLHYHNSLPSLHPYEEFNTQDFIKIVSNFLNKKCNAALRLFTFNFISENPELTQIFTTGKTAS